MKTFVSLTWPINNNKNTKKTVCLKTLFLLVYEKEKMSKIKSFNCIGYVLPRLLFILYLKNKLKPPNEAVYKNFKIPSEQRKTLTNYYPISLV